MDLIRLVHWTTVQLVSRAHVTLVFVSGSGAMKEGTMKSVCTRIILVSVPVAALALDLPGLAVAAPGDYGATYSMSAAPNPSANPLDKKESFLNGITPGKTYVVQVGVTNTGKLTWTKNNNEYVLTYRWIGPETSDPNDTTTYPQIPLPVAQVAPGQTVTFNATLKVPTTPGTYTLWWDMGRQATTFFSGIPCCAAAGASVPPAKQWVGVGHIVGGGQGLGGAAKYLSELCQWTDCSGETEEQLKCPTPSITGGDASPFISPGQYTYVTGCGFGNVAKKTGPIRRGELDYILPGHLVLTLQNGTKLTLESIDLDWYPELVGGKVPEAPAGTMDQPGHLVVTRGGFTSMPRPVHFQAGRTMQSVPNDAVKVNECNDSADENFCLVASIDCGLRFCGDAPSAFTRGVTRALKFPPPSPRTMRTIWTR